MTQLRVARRWVAMATAMAASGFAVTGGGGCGWFRGKDQAIRPLEDPKIYQSPLKADRGRTGDYRRDGVLQAAAQVPAAQPKPLVPPAAVVAGAAGSAGTGTATAIASTRAAAPQYLVLGSVVANVNGAPIYAHELIKQVAPLFRARAKELDQTRFRQLAQAELKRQRDNLIRDELEYAAAQRNTTQEEVREAKARTFMYRERLVSQAGGSLQMARQIARDQGEDFDRLLEREERRALVGIYYRKRIIPRVTITVDEMRRHYELNRERQFTVPAQATVRVVRIDVADVGDEARAMARIQEARRRIESGENFDAISDEYNRNTLLRDKKGVVGPLSKGSYAITELDDAIWKTETGKVTPVVKARNAFFVALVSDRREGRVMNFDEQEVQQAIQQSLREGKMLELQQKQRESLQRDAVIQADEQMLQPVVEMAMQMYGEWRADGNAPTPLLRQQ